ncbi:hypothetical protein [Staphylococcus sp. 17KM0847]|uniref:hypothetical protein n=1 Tax=Staphylococcus sp. 17KM0847 TaxID=2583989 RepID=UPI0015E003A6|nr:hypothetical protein [Staphylococcus sp. 17KM0847]
MIAASLLATALVTENVQAASLDDFEFKDWDFTKDIEVTDKNGSRIHQPTEG